MFDKNHYGNTTINTILITGGSSGFGLEMAKRYAEQGNTVILIIIRPRVMKII
ncbi:SDR family NAD(P)-dependent oxidoreductase [Sinomicrobium sp. M5D2P9]